MAQKQEKIPSMTLSDISTELDVINGQLFKLREGTKALLDAIKRNSIDECNIVISIYKLDDIIKSLEPKF